MLLAAILPTSGYGNSLMLVLIFFRTGENMYAIKASWVGQTFALATTNDSGGRKSQIRRSKEERKAMIESFIKRYEVPFIVFNINCLKQIHGRYC